MKWSKVRWLMLGIIVLGACLQVGVALRQTLWADEIFSIALATGHSLEHPAKMADARVGDFSEGVGPRDGREWGAYLTPDAGPPPLSRVIRATYLSDTSPPLYYVLLAVWIWIFNASDFAVRAFSITVALACVPLLAAIARRLGGRRSVWPACLLFVSSPFTIYYGTEARMYSLLWLCVSATALAALAARTARRRGFFALAFIASTVAGFLTHYFFIFPWAAMVCFLVFRPGRIRRGELVLWGVGIALLLLPWYLHLAGSLGNWRVTQEWLKWTPWDFNRWRSAWEISTQFFTGSARYVWQIHRKANTLALAVVAVIGLVAYWRVRGRILSRGRWLVLMWFAAACSGPFVFDLARGTYTAAVPRYAAAALPAACVLVAVGLGTLGRAQRIGAMVIILLTWLLNVKSIYQLRDRSGYVVGEAVAFIGNETTSRDVILAHAIPSAALGVARYYHGPAPLACWVGQLNERVVPASVQAITYQRERVYFVRIHDVGAPAPEEAWLRANAVVEREQKFGGNAVIVFRLPQVGLK